MAFVSHGQHYVAAIITRSRAFPLPQRMEAQILMVKEDAGWTLPMALVPTLTTPERALEEIGKNLGIKLTLHAPFDKHVRTPNCPHSIMLYVCTTEQSPEKELARWCKPRNIQEMKIDAGMRPHLPKVFAPAASPFYHALLSALPLEGIEDSDEWKQAKPSHKLHVSADRCSIYRRSTNDVTIWKIPSFLTMQSSTTAAALAHT